MERVAKSSSALSANATVQFFVTLAVGVAPTEVLVGANGNLKLDDGVRLLDKAGLTTVANAGPGVTQTGLGTIVGNEVPGNFIPPTTVNLVSVAPITLGFGTEVTGSVQAASQPTELLGAKIDGTLSVQPNLAVTDYTWNVTFPGAVTDVTLGLGQNATLAPGAYGHVWVGPASTLTLAPGTYTFSSLYLDLLGHVQVNTATGPLVVYVQSSLNLHRSIEISGGDASSFLLGYAGTADVCFEVPFSGTYVAPNSGVTLPPAIHQGAFFAESVEALPLAQLVHVPFSGWSTVIPLRGPPAPKSLSLAGVPPPQAAPPFAVPGDIPGFLEWAYASRPSQAGDLLAAVRAVAGNEGIGSALVTILNGDGDLGRNLVEISILGQLKTQAGLQYFTTLLSTPLPTTGTFVKDIYAGVPLEQVNLVKRQGRALDGLAMMLTPQADTVILNAISTSASTTVVARAVHNFLYVHGPSARATVSAMLPANEQILLDMIDVATPGSSYDTRLAAFLQQHPEVVPPPVTP